MADDTDGKGFLSYIPTPLQKHQQEIAKRGFTQEQAGQFTLSLSAINIQHLLEMDAPEHMSATAYPYYDIYGRPMTFHNQYGEQHYAAVRMHPPFDKSHKYLSPRTDSKVYYPQVADWRDLPDNAEVWFVEGEVKALKAMLKEDLHWCVGFAGHTRFVPHGKFPTELEQISLRGRRVNIVMDFDNKPDVMAAVELSIQKVCVALHLLGAKPYIVRLSKTKLGGTVNEGEKLGLDDYLDAGCTWKELQACTEVVPVEYIWTAMLLTDWVYVEDQNLVWKKDYADNMPVDWRHFTDENAHMHWRPPKGKEVYATKIYHDSPDKLRAKAMRFDPSTILGLTNDGYLSIFKGFREARDTGHALVQEWLTLGDRVCGAEWPKVLQFLAQVIQDPLNRPQWALSIISPIQGIGKSLLINLYCCALQNHALMGATAEDLLESENSTIFQNIFMFFDELGIDIGKRKNKDTIKTLITSPQVRVRYLYGRPFFPDIYTRFVVATNHTDKFPVSDEDRRWLMVGPEDEALVSSNEHKDWVKGMWGRLHDNQEFLHGMMWMLQRVDLTGFNPSEAPPQTAVFKQVVTDSRTSWEQHADLILDLMEEHGDCIINALMLEYVAMPKGCDGYNLLTMLKDRARRLRHAVVVGVSQIKIGGKNTSGTYFSLKGVDLASYGRRKGDLVKRGCAVCQCPDQS